MVPQLPQPTTSEVTAGCQVDVATGSGQALQGLIDLGLQVIALDSSELQLEHVRHLPGVMGVRRGDAHAMPFENSSGKQMTSIMLASISVREACYSVCYSEACGSFGLPSWAAEGN